MINLTLSVEGGIEGRDNKGGITKRSAQAVGTTRQDIDTAPSGVGEGRGSHGRVTASRQLRPDFTGKTEQRDGDPHCLRCRILMQVTWNMGSLFMHIHGALPIVPMPIGHFALS
jgi:hypothetical protein